ncbi:hypothetical protein ACRAWB_06395 [Leifsonia poae]|uniref:hypothetical protein n=1 Tax=Leifsonia poae TaxID=110933 RepID=UPI003D68B093
MQLTLNGGASASSSRVTLTAPSGTTFTGDVMYSNWTGGLPFTGELSDSGRTLTISLAMLPSIADDSLIPFATVQYTVGLRADDDLALKGPVGDGSWQAGGARGPLSYQADGVVPTDVTDPDPDGGPVDPDGIVDVPVVDPLVAVAGAGGLAVLAVVGALIAVRRRGRCGSATIGGA